MCDGFPEACLGGEIAGDTSCADGHTGPVCDLCVQDPPYFGGRGTPCQLCSDAGDPETTIIAYAIGGAVILIAILVAMAVCKRRATTTAKGALASITGTPAEVGDEDEVERATHKIPTKLEAAGARVASIVGPLGVKLRILISLCQVVSQLGVIFNVQYPPFYTSVLAAIENINGQAITLATKHRERRNPRDWRGFRFAVPFDFSIHNYLLRHYLAEHGLDPDRDVQIRSVPPPEMVANLRADNIDGFLGPDPFNQRAVFDGVGFIHILTKELWDGHPCCAFAVPRSMVTDTPNTFHALLRAIVEATAYSQNAANRREVAAAISGQNYLNQPQTVVEQVLTGTFADGLGRVQRVPDRIGFDPFPWHSMAMWIMTQMRRWGQLQREVDYRQVAEQVFLATDAARAMRDLGQPVPSGTTQSFQVMGRTFDPANPAPWTERNIRPS
jgi:hypothetical protein